VNPAPRTWSSAAAVGIPQSQNSSPRARAPLGAEGLDRHPGGAAAAGHVDVLDAGAPDARGGGARQAAAHLLHHHRHAELGHQPGQGFFSAAKVAVPTRLHQLHGRVEVHAKRVGLDLPDQVDQRLGRQLAGLHHADVPEQEDVGGQVAHPVGAGESGIIEHRPLAAEPHGQAQGLRSDRQVAIDRFGLRRAAGHAADVDRCREALSQQLDRRVDLVPAQLRQGLVEQLHVLEQRAAAPVVDLALSAKAEMVELALLDRIGHRGAPARGTGDGPRR